MLAEDDNSSSPASTTCSERIKSCTSEPREAEAPKANDGKFKRRLPAQPKAKTLRTESNFVKASDFLSDIENHTEIDDTHQLHFAASTTANTSVGIILFSFDLHMVKLLISDRFFTFRMNRVRRNLFSKRKVTSRESKGVD